MGQITVETVVQEVVSALLSQSGKTVIGTAIALGIVYGLLAWKYPTWARIFAGAVIVSTLVLLFQTCLRIQGFLIAQAAIVARIDGRQSPLKQEDVEGVLKQWATSFGWGTRPLEKQPKAKFLFEISIPQKTRQIPMVVGQTEDLPGYVVVSHTIRISPQQQAALAQMPIKEGDAFITELRVALAARGINYEGVQRPLSTIALSRNLALARSLADSDFLAAVNDANTARVIASELVISRLGSSGPP